MLCYPMHRWACVSFQQDVEPHQSIACKMICASRKELLTDLCKIRQRIIDCADGVSGNIETVCATIIVEEVIRKYQPTPVPTWDEGKMDEGECKHWWIKRTEVTGMGTCVTGIDGGYTCKLCNAHVPSFDSLPAEERDRRFNNAREQLKKLDFGAEQEKGD